MRHITVPFLRGALYFRIYDCHMPFMSLNFDMDGRIRFALGDIMGKYQMPLEISKLGSTEKPKRIIIPGILAFMPIWPRETYILTLK